MISKLPIRKATIAFTAIPIRLILVKLLIKAFNIKDLNHIYKTQHIVSANFINCYHQCSIPALIDSIFESRKMHDCEKEYAISC